MGVTNKQLQKKKRHFTLQKTISSNYNLEIITYCHILQSFLPTINLLFFQTKPGGMVLKSFQNFGFRCSFIAKQTFFFRFFAYFSYLLDVEPFLLISHVKEIAARPDKILFNKQQQQKYGFLHFQTKVLAHVPQPSLGVILPSAY